MISDLHDEFIRILHVKIPKKSDLVNRISDILSIEKESAYRRLNGKVNFSVREMGILAKTFNISIDHLLHKNTDQIWLPFSLFSPLEYKTMDSVVEMLDSRVTDLLSMTKQSTEAGCIYCSLPVEFYMHYPLLLKFMFFKWGYNYVGTGEYNNFSDWKIPQKLDALSEKINKVKFSKMFYVWDNSITWNLVNEIENFYRMHIITREEKEALRFELKHHLTKLEEYLKGIFTPDNVFTKELEFYVSTINLGFTCTYFSSEKECNIFFQTSFSHSVVDNCNNSCDKIKEWIKSLRNTSVLISGSGSLERRLFFEKQHNIIDAMLK